MVYFGVDLYRFSLICNDCFRKVVYKKEKGDEQIVLTPSISESNIKFLKISSLFPPEGFSTLSKRLSPMFKTAFSNVQMFADLFKTCSPAVSLSIFMSIFAS